MLPYHPGLRFKLGEYSGAGSLAPDVKRQVEPRFVVPPPKDYDHELERLPNIGEIAYCTGDRIGKHWPIGRCFLDIQYIADDLDDDAIRRLFRLAQTRNSSIVPIATLRHLPNPLFQEVQCAGRVKLAILVTYEEAADPEAIAYALNAAGFEASECTLFIDFTGAPLDPEIAVGSVTSIFDLVDQIGLWQRIIFQASNFPNRNPADHGGDALIPRNEWTVFHAAMRECGVAPHRLGYGDFAADHGEMEFSRKKGGAPAIRHIRYTTKSDTLVVRGENTGTDQAVMRDVCKRIVRSGSFAGQSFSPADDKIFRLADPRFGAGPGNSSTWREWNTNHHITRVVRDLGAMDGITFDDVTASIVPDQYSLLELDDDE